VVISKCYWFMVHKLGYFDEHKLAFTLNSMAVFVGNYFTRTVYGWWLWSIFNYIWLHTNYTQEIVDSEGNFNVEQTKPNSRQLIIMHLIIQNHCTNTFFRFYMVFNTFIFTVNNYFCKKKKKCLFILTTFSI